MPGEDSDTPIADGVEGLRELRDREMPKAVDARFEVLRGDIQNVRRLVDRARRHLPADTPVLLEEHARALDEIGATLRDELAAAITPIIDELDALRRHADGDSAAASTTSASVRLPSVAKPSPPRHREADRDVIYVSSSDPDHADFLKDPPPDYVIVVDEAFVYTTDDIGRVERAQATLVLRPPGKRKPYQQRTLPGKEDDDDAGHLFATSLGGIGDQLNLTPMDRRLNRSDFASVENEWREAVKANKSVEVTIDLRYRDDGNRPSVLLVTYKIEGQNARRLRLPNRLPGDTT